MSTGREEKKYIVLVGDGMADYPVQELGNKTPLEAGKTPNMDRIAAGKVGLARTVPEGMEPGSDVANLSVLGCDPRIYHTGRGPLEAASMGVELVPEEVAFRMNLVTLDWRGEEVVMVSHNSGDITTEETAPLFETLRKEMIMPGVRMYPGVAYRHIFLWNGGPEKVPTIPPHDVLDQDVAGYLGQVGDNPIPAVIRHSWHLLKDHPINLQRRQKGLLEANSIWLWGQGRPPRLPGFKDRFGLNGGVISAVDLIKGIGHYCGFVMIEVEGATGYLDTNYTGKAEAAISWLKDHDFVFLHVEAPDEAGHHGDPMEKIEAIENFDQKVVGPVLEGLEQFKDYNVMVLSDHLTPVVKKTHSAEPTPFAWASKEEIGRTAQGPGFAEKPAAESGIFVENGYELLPWFLTA